MNEMPGDLETASIEIINEIGDNSRFTVVKT